jgi:hypothetical protein
VLAAPVTALRAAGLSGRKAEYLQSLAAAFAEQRLSSEALAALSDDAAVAALTQVRGLGVWSAHMFLIFGLNRADVLPWGDFVASAKRIASCTAAVRRCRHALSWRPRRRPGRRTAAWRRGICGARWTPRPRREREAGAEEAAAARSTSHRNAHNASHRVLACGAVARAYNCKRAATPLWNNNIVQQPR